MPSDKDKSGRLYADLAWLWPVISRPEEYVSEADEIAALLRQHAKRQVRLLLDLGCGGGHADFALKRHVRIVGVDRSDTMLAQARALNPEVSYLLGDLRHPPTDELFDAVLLGDAVNCMLTVDDLRAAFQAGYDRLAPGGVLCTFAEVSRERFSSPRTRVSEYASDPAHITFIEHTFDPDTSDTVYDLTLVFLIHRGQPVDVEVDHQQAGLFTLDTWRNTLSDIGFDVRAVTLTCSAVPGFVGVKPAAPEDE